MKEVNYLLGYKDMYIVQDAAMFKFSLDSILIPKFMTLRKSDKKILDIGCGNAPIPLILSTMSKALITGIEIQKDVYDMGIKSVKLNKLDEKIVLINDDVRSWYKEIESDSFDAITCNPPYFKVNKGSILNDKEYKVLARHEVALNLDDILLISKKLLKNNGVFAMVHRPNRLVEILEKMKKYNIEPKKIQFVYPRYGESANIVLIEGRKNGNEDLRVLNPIYVYDEFGKYTEEITKYFE